MGTFFSLAYYFGKPITDWVRHGEYVLTVAVAIVVSGLGIYLWRRHVKKRTAGKAESERPAESKNA